MIGADKVMNEEDDNDSCHLLENYKDQFLYYQSFYIEYNYQFLSKALDITIHFSNMIQKVHST
jgi:hypothetical protein